VVAQPCEAIWELDKPLDCVSGPFATQGAKGEEEYP
jgi:hypothetical protein